MTVRGRRRSSRVRLRRKSNAARPRGGVGTVLDTALCDTTIRTVPRRGSSITHVTAFHFLTDRGGQLYERRECTTAETSLFSQRPQGRLALPQDSRDLVLELDVHLSPSQPVARRPRRRGTASTIVVPASTTFGMAPWSEPPACRLGHDDFFGIRRGKRVPPGIGQRLQLSGIADRSRERDPYTFVKLQPLPAIGRDPTLTRPVTAAPPHGALGVVVIHGWHRRTTG